MVVSAPKYSYFRETAHKALQEQVRVLRENRECCYENLIFEHDLQWGLMKDDTASTEPALSPLPLLFRRDIDQYPLEQALTWAEAGHATWHQPKLLTLLLQEEMGDGKIRKMSYSDVARLQLDSTLVEMLAALGIDRLEIGLISPRAARSMKFETIG